jgi:protein-tyrosine-phosphatase
MAERFAQQRLRALAHVELAAQAGVPAVLFLCVHNAGRSQMALGFFTALAGDEAVAWSGGADPLHAIDQAVVEAMREVGIDLGEEFPKPWTDEILRAVDLIVTMGCAENCPDVPGSRYLDWELDDPAGLEIAAVRRIRDAVEAQVRGLLGELGVSGSGSTSMGSPA